MSELAALDRAFQTTRVWLHEIGKELQWKHERRVYTATKAVLHALRDRLTVQEAVEFGAQLPTFIRGLYYEGWRPGLRKLRNRSKEAFFDEIRETFLRARMPGVAPDHVTQSLLRFLNRKIAEGELEDVRAQLPKSIRPLWPKHSNDEAA